MFRAWLISILSRLRTVRNFCWKAVNTATTLCKCDGKAFRNEPSYQWNA